MEERESRKKGLPIPAFRTQSSSPLGFRAETVCKKCRVARWRHQYCSQMEPTETKAGTSLMAVAKEPNDRDRNAHRR